MLYNELKRDAGVIKSALKASGQQILTSKDIKIVIPYRYAQSKLATIGNSVQTLAVFAVIVDGYYAVSNLCSTMTLTPSSTTVVSYEGEDYFEFSFDKGSVVTPNINLVVDDKNAYNIYNEFIAKGRVPWFMSYEDFGKILTTAHSHAGITLSGTNAPLELILTSISRNSKNLYQYYRNTIKSLDEQLTNPPSYVPFKSVSYGATNTAGKIMGSYFDEGLTSALTAPEGGPEGVEVHLRK